MIILTIFFFITACGYQPIYIKKNETGDIVVIEDKSDPSKNMMYNFKPNEIFKASDLMVDSLTKLLDRERNKFLEDIGFRESSGNYKAVNQFGYLGKYQFGRKTLNSLGFDNVTNREFLENPSFTKNK